MSAQANLIEAFEAALVAAEEYAKGGSALHAEYTVLDVDGPAKARRAQTILNGLRRVANEASEAEWELRQKLHDLPVTTGALIDVVRRIEERMIAERLINERNNLR